MSVNNLYLKFSELPRPNLGDLSELKTMKIKLKRTKNPNVLGYAYSELLELDKVEVELEPDKKGLILKHREYTVSSRVKGYFELYFQNFTCKYFPPISLLFISPFVFNATEQKLCKVM